ncbi:aminoacyl-tRNA hydrolase [Desulfothermus okinawensis JCM 13304]
MLVGLGNPGPEYEITRHNVGFLFVDQLKSKRERYIRSLHANKLCESFMLADPKIPWCIVVKPLTFMNLSGVAVEKLANDFNISPENIFVIHDDLDIGLGRMKLKFGGGHAGHNGLKSIINHLGTRDFYRLRIGIGRPGPDKKINIRDWVLSPFEDFEMTVVKKVLDIGIQGIYCFFSQGKDNAINFINGFRVENFAQSKLK